MLNQLNCPNCGAALPLPASDTEVITCQYCHTTFRIPKTVTPEPDLGDLMLGADFSQKPIPGWDFPNEGNIQMIKGNPPELRAKFTAADSLEYVLNNSGFFDDVDASVSTRFYEGDLKYIDAGLVVRYKKGSWHLVRPRQGRSEQPGRRDLQISSRNLWRVELSPNN